MKLVIVGNWNNSKYGISLKENYKDIKNIFLFDPIYDQREIDLIRSNASLYIHGHSAGGTNPSLVEAMFLSLPVIAFDVSYNKTTTENKALYFDTSEDLMTLLNTITELKLRELRIEMKAIATRRYTWKIISRQYELLIKEALLIDLKNSVLGEVQKLDPSILQEYQISHFQNSILFYEK